MKKKFLKVALFSLIMAAPATTFVSCSDYDDDITNLTNNDDKLQDEFNNKLDQQAKAVDAKIEELKTAQAAIEAQAKQAGEAAAAAASKAEQAQKTGDDALAQAMAANAQAEAALKAVADAKAEVLAQTIEQMEALKTSIESQINELKSQYGKDFETITAALKNCATKGDITELEQKIASLNNLSTDDVNALIKQYLTNVGINETTISGINGRLQAIDSSIEAIKTDVAGNTAKLTEICDQIIPGLKEELTGIISALDTRVTDHIAAFNQYKTQVDAQLLALNNFKETYETLLAGLSGQLSGLDSKIDGVASDLDDLKALVEGMTGEDSGIITELRGSVEQQAEAIAAINNKITGIQNDIKEINGNLNVLAQQNAKRLTSITLVPTAYREGIPTIDFFTASFKPLGKLDKETGLYAAAEADAKAVSINSENAKVLYRLNPAGVTLEDIETPSFVQVIATSRSGNEAVLDVVDFKKSEEGEGILEVFAKKNVDTNVDNAGQSNNFYTVALRVPIAAKNLYTWTEGEGDEKVTKTEDPADAVVFSEYARISDTYFTPALTATTSLETPEYAETNLHAWANIAAADILTEVNYNSVTDLSAYVTGCMNYDNKHVVMSADDMNMFGFTIEYAVFGQEYNVNGVNQQVYASISKDGKLTPVTPENGNILDRLGKTPVIEVVMKDKAGNVIAQEFVKVKLTLGDANTKFTITYPSVELSCSAFDEVVTWDAINSEIISKLGFAMTKEQFVANYAATAPAGVIVNLNATGEEDDQPIIWTVGVADMILGGEDLTLSKEIKFTNAAGLYPDLTLTLKVTVEWPANLPSLGKTVPAFWNNNVMRVLPQAMPVGGFNGSTATYDTNILTGRVAPYLNNLLDCATWDIVFKTAPAGYEVDEDNSYVINIDADPAVVAARLWYGNADKAEFDLNKADASDTELEANFFIENNAAGIAMVENEMTVGLGWNIQLNGNADNMYSLNSTSVKIIKPLQSLTTAAVAPLTQNSQAQTRDLAANMTITDAFGNEFVAGTDYWKYYGITKVDWTSGTPTITDNGVDYTPQQMNYQINISEAGVLTFTGNGIAIQHDLTLNIPVVVTHKWGKLNQTVHVTIKLGL